MKRIMPIGSASLAAAGLLLSAGSFAQTTTVTAELPPKSEATQRIKGEQLKAIKDVGAGRSLLDNRAAAALMAQLRGAAESSDPLSALTDQERVLLNLLGEGLTNRQIAARMFLAEKTVKNYVSRLLAKLGMERRTQAAVFVSKLEQQRTREN